MDYKRWKLFVSKQSQGCKFMHKMHRNMFGGRACWGGGNLCVRSPRSLSRNAGEAYFQGDGIPLPKVKVSTITLAVRRTTSPVRYVTDYSFVQNFWRFGKLYIFGNLLNPKDNVYIFFRASYGSRL